MRSLTISKLLGAAASLTFISSGILQAQEEGEQDRFTLMLGGSFTGAGDLEFAGATLGEVETTRYRFEGSYMIPISESWMFEIGGEYNLLQTDHSLNASLIPEDLTKIALNLRTFWNIDEKWALSASLSPGFYGDDEVDFSDAFNAPLMLLGQWQKSDSVSVAFGLRVDAFSDMPVLPVLGVNWKINPEWELALGAPRTELRYKWSEQLSLYGGAAFEGESYAVNNPSLVTPLGRPLRDTYVSESEIRALLGLEYQLQSGLKFTVEGGYAFDRKFDYHEQNVELDIDSGAFGALSVSYSF